MSRTGVDRHKGVSERGCQCQAGAEEPLNHSDAIHTERTIWRFVNKLETIGSLILLPGTEVTLWEK